jgi:LysM repeat protein
LVKTAITVKDTTFVTQTEDVILVVKDSVFYTTEEKRVMVVKDTVLFVEMEQEQSAATTEDMDIEIELLAKTIKNDVFTVEIDQEYLATVIENKDIDIDVETIEYEELFSAVIKQFAAIEDTVFVLTEIPPELLAGIMKDTYPDIETEQLAETTENEALAVETEQSAATIEKDTVLPFETEQIAETTEKEEVVIAKIETKVEKEVVPTEVKKDTAKIDNEVLPVKIEPTIVKVQDTIILIPKKEKEPQKEELAKSGKNELMSGSVVYISGKKYVMYKVEQGDNLFQIATKFKPVTMEEIMSANHLKETSVLLIGQMLRIPIY